MLKKFVVVIALFVSTVAFAQGESTGTLSAYAPKETYAVGFYMNPVYLALGTLKGGVDFGLGPKVSLGANIAWMPEQDWDRYDYSFYNDNIRASSLHADLDATIFVIGTNRTRGLYISPAIGYAKATAKLDDLEGSLEGPYLETAVGWQWVWSNFRLGLGGGPRYFFTKNKDIILKNTTTRSETRVKTDNLVGAVIDIHVGFVF